ncbi:MAG: thioredoxin-disulfide reductase [Clostridia bacterium]|jgi:thioredoxin reductase (NADPH)|nr:thioredoxin-disulfide reductase [Clostridia bacterium]MDD4145590.1 thioredoxin-disulfide reductase [Clostridia bacterium]
MTLSLYDVLIIGGGPAGLTAAIYACRAGWKTLLIERGTFGGQAASTDIIENYPGFPAGISGFELMMDFYKQASRFGCEFLTAEVLALSTGGKSKKVVTSEGEVAGKTIILATGAMPRELGVRGEQDFRGKGVSYCATCDGFFYKNKKVAVVGGGDAAVKEALYLAKIVREVVLIHRRGALRADKVLGDKALGTPNLKVYWDTVVDEIVGDSKINSLKLHHVKTQETMELTVDGVFIYVGTKPNTEFLGGDFQKNPQGYLLTDESLETTASGVFAIGDCRRKNSRQVATAVGDGALVLAAAEGYLQQA